MLPFGGHSPCPYTGSTPVSSDPRTGVASVIFQRGADSFSEGLKYGFLGTINAKNLRKNRVSPSDGGLSCSDGGDSPIALP